MLISKEINSNFCPHCGDFVNFQQRSSFRVENNRGQEAAQVRHDLCPSCEQVSVVLIEPDHETWKRFPLALLKQIPWVPPNIMSAYQEAQLALEAGAPRAAACMLRRVVASVCSEQGIPDAFEDGRYVPLPARIDQLKAKLIPATYAAAKKVKLFGDAGAHEEAELRLGEVDPDDVRNAIKVVRQFLANIYELPGEVSQL